MIRIFLLFFIFPKIIFSAELNLICTNNYIDVRSLDVKDVFLIIDYKTKRIELGGLNFFADNFKLLKTVSLLKSKKKGRPSGHDFLYLCFKDKIKAVSIFLIGFQQLILTSGFEYIFHIIYHSLHM